MDDYLIIKLSITGIKYWDKIYHKNEEKEEIL